MMLNTLPPLTPPYIFSLPVPLFAYINPPILSMRWFSTTNYKDMPSHNTSRKAKIMPNTLLRFQMTLLPLSIMTALMLLSASLPSPLPPITIMGGAVTLYNIIWCSLNKSFPSTKCALSALKLLKPSWAYTINLACWVRTLTLPRTLLTPKGPATGMMLTIRANPDTPTQSNDDNHEHAGGHTDLELLFATFIGDTVYCCLDCLLSPVYCILHLRRMWRGDTPTTPTTPPNEGTNTDNELETTV